MLPSARERYVTCELEDHDTRSEVAGGFANQAHMWSGDVNSENAEGPVALTADDDEFFRMALKSILLKQLGAREVIETGSFDAALKKLAERKEVSLAMFDLQMPGIDDPGSLRLVRESFPDIRVVVVSSSQQRENILAALEAGAHGYLPKSLGPGDLARALSLVLQGMIFVPPVLAELPRVHEALGMAPSDTIVPSLTPRQQQVLELLVKGNSNKSIARALGLGEGTVKIHVAALFRNLGVTNRATAAVLGARLLAMSNPQEKPKRRGDG